MCFLQIYSGSVSLTQNRTFTGKNVLYGVLAWVWTSNILWEKPLMHETEESQLKLFCGSLGLPPGHHFCKISPIIKRLCCKRSVRYIHTYIYIYHRHCTFQPSALLNSVTGSQMERKCLSANTTYKSCPKLCWFTAMFDRRESQVIWNEFDKCWTDVFEFFPCEKSDLILSML